MRTIMPYRVIDRIMMMTDDQEVIEYLKNNRERCKDGCISNHKLYIRLTALSSTIEFDTGKKMDNDVFIGYFIKAVRLLLDTDGVDPYDRGSYTVQFIDDDNPATFDNIKIVAKRKPVNIPIGSTVNGITILGFTDKPKRIITTMTSYDVKLERCGHVRTFTSREVRNIMEQDSSYITYCPTCMDEAYNALIKEQHLRFIIRDYSNERVTTKCRHCNSIKTVSRADMLYKNALSTCTCHYSMITDDMLLEAHDGRLQSIWDDILQINNGMGDTGWSDNMSDLTSFLSIVKKELKFSDVKYMDGQFDLMVMRKHVTKPYNSGNIYISIHEPGKSTRLQVDPFKYILDRSSDARYQKFVSYLVKRYGGVGGISKYPAMRSIRRSNVSNRITIDNLNTLSKIIMKLVSMEDSNLDIYDISSYSITSGSNEPLNEINMRIIAKGKPTIAEGEVIDGYTIISRSGKRALLQCNICGNTHHQSLDRLYTIINKGTLAPCVECTRAKLIKSIRRKSNVMVPLEPYLQSDIQLNSVLRFKCRRCGKIEVIGSDAILKGALRSHCMKSKGDHTKAILQAHNNQLARTWNTIKQANRTLILSEQDKDSDVWLTDDDLPSFIESLTSVVDICDLLSDIVSVTVRRMTKGPYSPDNVFITTNASIDT